MSYETVKNANETSKNIDSFLRKRERNRRALNLPLLAYNMERNGLKFDEKEFNGYFEELEKQNIGKRKKDYFVWEKPMLVVLGVQKAETEEATNVVSIKKSTRKRGRPAGSTNRQLGLKTVVVAVRKGLDLRFDVPQDFSQDDARAVYRMLKRAAS